MVLKLLSKLTLNMYRFINKVLYDIITVSKLHSICLIMEIFHFHNVMLHGKIKLENLLLYGTTFYFYFYIHNDI